MIKTQLSKFPGVRDESGSSITIFPDSDNGFVVAVRLEDQKTCLSQN
jgi:hypothetical protein